MVIFDTNILVSAALLSGSQADLCVRAVLARNIPLIFSAATHDELADVLMRPKLDRYVQADSRGAAADMAQSRGDISRGGSA